MFKVAPVLSLWLQYSHIALFCPQQSGLLGSLTVCKLFTAQCRLLLRTGFSCQPSQGIPVPCEPGVSGCCASQDKAEGAFAQCMEQQVKLPLNFLQRRKLSSAEADKLALTMCLAQVHRGSCSPVAALADPSSGKAQQGLHTLWYFLWLYAEPLLSEQLPNMLLAWWGLTGTSPPAPTNCAHLPCCGFQHHFRNSRM